jgi:CheY-like chemotaxis protein
MLLDQLNCAYYPIFNPLLFPYGAHTSPERMVKRVLIIDDDHEMIELLKLQLSEDRRMKIFYAEDPFEAIEIMSQQVMDAIILDWSLPQMTGPETLSKTEQVFKSDPNLPFEWENKKTKVVIMTGRERSECRPSSTRHFKYSGFINKNGANLISIVESIQRHLVKVEL